MDHATVLSRMVLPDRFEITLDPLGWRCRSCGAARLAEGRSAGGPSPEEVAPEVNDLAEAAADHAIECGRCRD